VPSLHAFPQAPLCCICRMELPVSPAPPLLDACYTANLPDLLTPGLYRSNQCLRHV
jgi:hypothetical protein